MYNARYSLIVMTALIFFLPFYLEGRDKGGLLEQVLSDSRFSWRSISDEEITIYYLEGSFAEKHRMMLLASLKTSMHEVLDLLEESEYMHGLNAFYLESRDVMESIVGKPYAGYSDWTAHSIFLVINPQWRSFERHEFAHIVTMVVWGDPNPTSGWMVEGIPVYCDGWCREYSIDQIAYSMLKNDQLPKPDILFNEYRTLGEIRAGFSSASLVGFIVNEFGTDKLRDLWHDGTDKIEDILGENQTAIYESWKEYIIKNAEDEIDVDLESIGKHGCG